MYLLFFLNQTQRECCRMGRALDWECGLDLTESPFFLFLKILFLERGREGNINVWLTLACPPTGDVAYNPGMCADWESNQPPFDLQTSIQSTEPHQSGQNLTLSEGLELPYYQEMCAINKAQIVFWFCVFVF